MCDNNLWDCWTGLMRERRLSGITANLNKINNFDLDFSCKIHKYPVFRLILLKKFQSTRFKCWNRTKIHFHAQIGSANRIFAPHEMQIEIDHLIKHFKFFVCSFQSLPPLVIEQTQKAGEKLSAFHYYFPFEETFEVL